MLGFPIVQRHVMLFVYSTSVFIEDLPILIGRTAIPAGSGVDHVLRRWLGCLSAILFPSLTIAQMPVPLAGPEEKIFRIVPKAVELKRTDGHWQIYSNRQLFKDFGSSEREASQAVRLIRELNLTQYATIPGAQPTFEYLLCDGQAPQGSVSSRTIVPFHCAN